LTAYALLTILPQVSRTPPAGTCTVCGVPLQGGVCPNGHPQRAARRRGRGRQYRLLRIASIPILIALLAYGGLYWYPVRAAASLMVASSAEFERVRAAYTATIQAFPNAPDSATQVQQAGAVLQAADVARGALTNAETRLEARTPISIPLLDRRPPLPLAKDLRERMLAFYLGSLELMADMQGVARYVTDLSVLLPRLEELRGALGNPKTPAEVDAVLPAARGIADQLLAGVEALASPFETSAIHESLRAIARTTRGRLDELDRVRGRTARPIVATLVAEIGTELDTFLNTGVGAPGAALEAGLSPRIAELDGQVRGIVERLARLRDEHGLDNVVVQELSL
jgi:hypothetical protein